MDNRKAATNFIKENFRKKYCSRFVAKDGTICYCGSTRDAHPKEREYSSDGAEPAWSAESDIVDAPTDAFGEIVFHNGNTAKYIRVSKNTNAEVLLALMIDHWKIKKPKLIISVTGGAQNFLLNARLKQVFRNGLIMAASSTEAWIVTGGTNVGVMKHVGEAVRDYTLKHGSKKPIVNIGIATWGCISNKHLLVNEQGSWPANYTAGDGKSGDKGESPLDINHSHFILVDNGTRMTFGVEIELRANLEKVIATKITEATEGGATVPRVVVVLEGGPNTLETVLTSMNSGAPAIVVEGSGRVADLLAFAYNNSQPLEVQATDSKGEKHTKVVSFYTDDFHDQLTSEIQKKFPSDDANKVKTTKEKIVKCIAKRDFLTIFQLQGHSSSDIDVVILKALVKTNKISKIDQLRLALDWNRADMAATEIYTDSDDDKFKVKDIESLMFKSLLENKVEFVKLFLARDFNLRRFLYEAETRQIGPMLRDRLRLLYTHPVTKDRCQLLRTGEFNLRRVGDLVSFLTGEAFEHRYRKIEKSGAWTILHDPANDLFLWCVFVRYREMAMLFWELSKHATAAAITAQHMTKSLLDRYPEAEFSEALRSDGQYYGGVAVGLLGECYNSDQRRTAKLLTQKLAAYGDSDVLKMAVMADNKEFVAHPASQNLLTEKWMGRMSENNYFILILISLIVPFLAPLLVRFSNVEEINEQSEQDVESNQNIRMSENGQTRLTCSNYFALLKCFYSAPFTAFCYNCASYFAFLLLFGIIMLTDFYPIRLNSTPAISVKEIILIIWVASLLLEEIRQVLTEEAKTLASKLLNYCKDFWNIMDVFILSLYVAGLILRLIPTSVNANYFYAARIVLSFCLLSFFMRILYMFSIHKELGPKLVIMGKMMIDLFYFMLILMVFISAYGISTHIIMYPNQPLNIALARDVLSSAWWNIHGEFNLEKVSGEMCQKNSSKLDASDCAAFFTRDDDWSQCLGKKEMCPAIDWLVPIMLAFYALVIQIMMLNILIAIFSNTFSEIQSQTNLVWKTQRYSLVREFETKPTLPPPLNLIGLFYQIIVELFNCCKNAVSPTTRKLKVIRNANQSAELSNWESIYAKEFRLKEASNSDSNTLSEVDFDSEDEFENLSNRIGYMEKQMDHASKAIEWIVQKLMGDTNEKFQFVNAQREIEIEEETLLNLKKMEEKIFQKEIDDIP